MAGNHNNTGSDQPRNYHKASADRMVDFQRFARRYESTSLLLNKYLFHTNYETFVLVNNDFAMKLRGLEGYEFAFICDDSGSMNTPLGKDGNSFLRLHDSVSKYR
jgi:hypothetical protein